MVMTIWQTGIAWAPRDFQLETDIERAAEHVGTQLAAWTRRFARALTLHKNHPDSIVARRRSGYRDGQHGLTLEELRARCARQTAEENYDEAKDLQNKIRRGKRERVDGSREKLPHDLRNGSLRRRMEQARAKCRSVQSPPFSVPRKNRRLLNLVTLAPHAH